MNSATVIVLDHVCMHYKMRRKIHRPDYNTALNAINLSLHQGETLGVVGRNGCGKSTLLQILAGIIAPTTGTLKHKPGLTRAQLSLSLGFNRELSGRDNAMLGAMLQGYSRAEAAQLLPEIQAYAELGKFFDQPVKSYSAGMRAKLGFATAINSNVDVLLIDETLSVGDSYFKAKAEQSMAELVNSHQTVVFVSHSGEQVRKICNRAIWLEQGSVTSSGSAEQVCDEYKDFMCSLTKSQQ
ncbi:MAG: ATP-binding cassette domain-containing protein [Gammaproteobacteria bacterium]|jgi:lipopolysaccharide transport system ATP-binding protein|nr:ATP-binding cassette domain-containing protein [Gammaproteobacteria bacterium]